VEQSGVAEHAGAVVQAVFDRSYTARLRAVGMHTGQCRCEPVERGEGVQHFSSAEYAQDHVDMRDV